MHSSVETRYPFLDDDVITFCAGIAPEYKLHGMTEKWILRQVAARTLPPQIANRPKTMFRAEPLEDLPRDRPPGLGRPAPQPRVAPRDRLLRPRRRSPASGAAAAAACPRITARRFVLRRRPDLRRLDPALAPPLLRRPLRPAHLDPARSSTSTSLRATDISTAKRPAWVDPMRAVLQRVSRASVEVEGQVVGRIERRMACPSRASPRAIATRTPIGWPRRSSACVPSRTTRAR